MNKRIRELFLQAGFHPPVVKRMGDEYKFEKFVELIVQECFKAAMIESKGHMNPIDLMKRMKERVGVEE